MKRSWAGALLTSALVHATFVAAGAWLLAQALGGSARTIEVTIREVESARGIELPTMVGVGTQRAPDPTAPATRAEPKPRAAGRSFSVARPDLQRAGRGGASEGARALSLADTVASVALDRDGFDGRRQSQVQRLATAARRQSLDDRRATPNPMQLTFVATGPGKMRLRRPDGVASAGAARGALESSRHGGRPGELGEDGWVAAPAEARQVGSLPRELLGSGATGAAPSLRARVSHARPAVTRARAAVPARTRARAADIIDSEAKVASTVRSLIQAGGLGDAHAGVGGEPGPGERGRDGQRSSGARARASGTGDGVGFSRDAGLGRYHQRLLSQIDWRRAFPTWAIAEGRGGSAEIGLTVHSDGNVSQVRVIRPSGIPEFDENLISAIRRGAPFGPLPPAAGGQLRLQIVFDAINPAVGREGPGPGARRR